MGPQLRCSQVHGEISLHTDSPSMESRRNCSILFKSQDGTDLQTYMPEEPLMTCIHPINMSHTPVRIAEFG